MTCCMLYLLHALLMPSLEFFFLFLCVQFLSVLRAQLYEGQSPFLFSAILSTDSSDGEARAWAERTLEALRGVHSITGYHRNRNYGYG
jgi:hypothetical protein